MLGNLPMPRLVRRLIYRPDDDCYTDLNTAQGRLAPVYEARVWQGAQVLWIGNISDDQQGNGKKRQVPSHQYLDKETLAMAKLWMKRIVFALCMGLLAGLVAAATGEAGSLRQEGPIRTDCQECHESVVTNWEDSAHGKAASDPVFQQAWQEQGSPQECLSCHTTGFDPETGTWHADGIGCSVCHSSQTGPHPETAMPTDSSARLCGTCHLDTYDEWQVSAHGEGEMTCVRCHNPHTTALKVGNMGDLCTTCHNQEGHYFGHTSHAQEGLLCTDCHMRVAGSPMGEGHGQRLHTFTVDLDTCTECHGMEMHFPVLKEDSATGGLMWSTYAAEDVPTSSEVQQPINDAPSEEPAGPLNYLLVVVVGMAFGVALSPWVEGFYRRLAKKD